MWQYNDMTGKQVVVHASGLTYEGRLIEMNETSLMLRAETGFREILLEQVTRVVEVEGASANSSSSSSILGPSPLKQFEK